MQTFLSKADNTVKGLKTVKPLFNSYNRTVSRTIYPADVNETEGIVLYSEAEITPNIFDGFAKFLYDYRFTDKQTKEEKYYSPGSALQYLSGAYVLTKEAYPRLPLWTEKYDSSHKIPEWYGIIRNQFKSILVKRIIEMGDRLQPEKSIPIGRELLAQLVRGCEDLGKVMTNVNSNVEKSILMRYCFITHYLVCGR